MVASGIGVGGVAGGDKQSTYGVGLNWYEHVVVDNPQFFGGPNYGGHDRLDRRANRRQPGMAAPLLGLLISFQSADQADQFPMCSRIWVLQLIEAMRIRQAAEIDERANPLPPRLLQVR